MLNVILGILAFIGFAAFCVGMYCLFKFYILDRIDTLEKRVEDRSRYGRVFVDNDITSMHPTPFVNYSTYRSPSGNSVMTEIHNLKATAERLEGYIDDIYENINDPDEEITESIAERVKKLEEYLNNEDLHIPMDQIEHGLEWYERENDKKAEEDENSDGSEQPIDEG